MSATNIQHYKEFLLRFQAIFTSEDFQYSSIGKFENIMNFRRERQRNYLRNNRYEVPEEVEMIFIKKRVTHYRVTRFIIFSIAPALPFT